MGESNGTRLYSSETSVLITGASSGIGAAVARHLAPYGGKIALVARRRDRLDEVAGQVAAAGGTPLVLVSDVTDPAAAAATHAEIVAQHGHIDFAFLNAGIGDVSSIDGFNAEQVRRTFEVNVFGVVNWLEPLLPPMIERCSGSIIGISSLAANFGGPASGSYCASKAAVSVLLESVRVEARQFGVHIFTVEPGFVKSELTAKNDFHMPFLMDAHVAARDICDAVEDGQPVIRFPWPMAAATRLLRLMPVGLYDRVAAKMFKASKSD